MFIEAAELESAVTDSAFPERDGLSVATGQLSAVTVSAARALFASWRGADINRSIAQLRLAADSVNSDALSASAVRRVSEGYAYYALHPEMYAAAALEFFRQMRPASAVCVGIRTIGAGLAAVVAAALESVRVPVLTCTVRPRGHPFDRTLALEDSLRVMLNQQSAGTHFLVVDEGPGISGTSFACVASALAGMQIPADRIHLFPGWNADAASLSSANARAVWKRHRKWHVEAQEAAVGIEEAVKGAAITDMSGGTWRHALYTTEDDWPAVMPQHERLKVLVPAEHSIVRFAGLGRYGRQRYARAATLAANGLGVTPGTLTQGYLTLPFQKGQPCGAVDVEETLVRHAGSHIGSVARAFPASCSTPADEIQQMIEVNVTEADGSLRVPALTAWDGPFDGAPSVAVDGRTQLHEWIRTSTGVVKVDALEHGADHFFPGPQDPAWDLAGVEAEFRLDRTASLALLDSYSALAGDRDVVRRLPYYRLAYAAFQLGYATFAGQSLGDPAERRRFDARRDFFLGRVRALLTAGSSQ
jgi:hypothetical protein